MDLFTGPVGSGQVHDFNPGIRPINPIQPEFPPSGLFWTQPISDDALNVDLEKGTATLELADLDEEDYHNLLNALKDGSSEDATVAFKMRWTAIERAMQVTDPTHGFTGRFRISKVQIEWSAQTPTFEFVSDKADTTINVSSVIGRERNGVFFSPGG
jgi:hypothetical protein